MKKLLNPKSRKGSYRLALPVGESDFEAVRSFMLDCLVPLLADEFLKRREVTATETITIESRKLTSEPLDKEGGL